jgi:hypothetical protein
VREEDSGTRLEALYTAYASAVPPVHTKALGKFLFAKMLASVYIGPHRGCDASKGLFLLRKTALPLSSLALAPRQKKIRASILRVTTPPIV